MTWTQEAMDAFVGAYAGLKVQFVPTVYQIPEEPAPDPTVQTPQVSDDPKEPTDVLPTEKPTEQSPVTTDPPVAAPTEQTQPQETENAGNQTNTSTGDAADNPTNAPTENPAADDEKEEPAAFPWVAVCIGAAVLLAAAGVVVWFRVKKRA